MKEYMAVVNLIPTGKENAISRERLAELAKLPDRTVREHIEQARRDGWYIITHAQRGGYYRTEDIDEIEYQYRIDRARALSVLSRLKAMRRCLKDAGRNV